jgi:hypothetical protein
LLNVSIAVYCWVPVTGIDASAGITTNETDVAAFTFKVAEPDMLLKVAVIIDDVPPTLPVAKPDAALTEALELFELQVDEAVTSMDDPSLYIAVALNCWVPVTGTEDVGGVTCMDVNERACNQCPV